MNWKIKKIEKETEPSCHHCGRNIKWVCWIENEAGESMAVGTECCHNFLSFKDYKGSEKQVKLLKKEEILKSEISDLISGKSENDTFRIIKAFAGISFMEKFYPEIFEKRSELERDPFLIN